MTLEELNGTLVMNHADNFFAFAATATEAECVADALSSAIVGLSGGDFEGKTKQLTTIDSGFRMLGCWVSRTKEGILEADPTDANVKALRTKARKQKQRTCARLADAAKSGSVTLRIEGIQEYLRFQSLVDGWVQAFAFCGPLVDSVAAHYEFELAHVSAAFAVTQEELAAMKDRSTVLTIELYSGD